MTTNERPAADDEIRYLLKRSDEVFGAIHELINTGKYDLETLRSLEAEASALAGRLKLARARKYRRMPADTESQVTENA